MELFVECHELGRARLGGFGVDRVVSDDGVVLSAGPVEELRSSIDLGSHIRFHLEAPTDPLGHRSGKHLGLA